MNRVLKILFFGLIIKPLVFLTLGLNIRGRNNLPRKGPAILSANHNSHLDTMVLMSLYPLSIIHRVRPVAAADYFLKNKIFAWFSLNILGIIPLDRSGKSKTEKLFEGCHQALDEEQILLIFPEGSRGKPEEMSRLKKGLYYVIKDRPNTQVTPIVLHGLGKALPRGEALLVPFNCDVIIDEALPPCDNSSEFLKKLLDRYQELFKYCLTRNNDTD